MECWLWFSRSLQKETALKSCWETSHRWKMKNHKPCRRRKDLKSLEEKSAYRSSSPLDRASIDLQRNAAERGVHRLRADHFFFEASFAKTVEIPSPQTNALCSASFCELLRWPLTMVFIGVMSVAFVRVNSHKIVLHDALIPTTKNSLFSTPLLEHQNAKKNKLVSHRNLLKSFFSER